MIAQENLVKINQNRIDLEEKLLPSALDLADEAAEASENANEIKKEEKKIQM